MPSKKIQYLLIAIGFSQMLGFVLQFQPLVSLGFLSNASPLPLVFSIFRGIEPFSSLYDLEIDTADRGTRFFRVTPELYAKLSGPYHYRNTYGAAFAGGPMLTSPREQLLVAQIIRYGFCKPGNLAKEFAVEGRIQSITITQTSRARGIPGQWKQVVRCL